MTRIIIIGVLLFVSLVSHVRGEERSIAEKPDPIAQEAEDEDESLDKARVVQITHTRHSKDEVLQNDFITLDSFAVQPGTLTDLVASAPGLSRNGQPGLFQTINIRGLARHRVQAYINGMRITSERRAGVAASFVDTLLLGGVEVAQGPAATYYGSGAIGGTVHLQTRETDGLWLNTGWRSDGQERVVAAGHGGESYSASLAFRKRNNGETINGEPKNNHFSQHALNFSKRFSWADYQLEWQLIESQGKDLGKDNLRFPESRITDYPEESHLLSQLILNSAANWRARFYFHDQRLQTRDIRPESRINTVTSNSLDYGLSLEDSWQLADFDGLFGVDYFGRRDVSSDEIETDINGVFQEATRALDEADEDEYAVFTTINRQFTDWSLHGGLRTNYQQQRSRQSASVSDSFTTYFLAAKKYFNQYEVSMTYGTGFRFANLSERLFSGTTGRGQTLGNAALRPEESKAFDLALSYNGENLQWELHHFENTIDEFIERIEVAEDLRSFQNLTRGEINGWQYQLDYHLSDSWLVELAGQGVRGVGDTGNPLADIPPQQHRLSFRFDSRPWFAQLDLVYRKAKGAVGDGEIPLQAANLASFKLGYQINSRWLFNFVVENLNDETYFNSADDLGTLAAGRSFGLSLSYQ